MDSQKFTIDEINFDEIYDLIDYDRNSTQTSSNSSSTFATDSPKFNQKKIKTHLVDVDYDLQQI